MSDQLALALPERERRYTCCGLPCGGLHERPTVERPFPHAEDCPNPTVDLWIDRSTGCIIRRMHCGDDVMAGRKPCPHGGRCPSSPGVVDPYDGACCLTLRRRDAGAT